MTAFDAPKYLPTQDASPIRSAWACIATRPWVIAAGLIALSILVAAALLLLLLAQNLPRLIDGLVIETKVPIILDSQMTRSESEAMRARIVAVPDVLTADLRTRETSLQALGNDLGTLPRGQNPLPDVWIVTLKPPTSRQRVSAYFERVLKTLDALPGVQTAIVDPRWVARIDAWQEQLERTREPTMLLFSGLTVVLLVCVAYLTARACVAESEFSAGFSVLACVGMLLAMATCAIALGVVWFIDVYVAPHVASDWKLLAASMGHMDPQSLVAIVVSSCVAITLGTVAGQPSR